MNPEDAQLYFARAGVEYYVNGRFSWFCHYFSTTGVLFHHAIEMLLKAKLLDKFSLDELSKRPFGHNLLGLWDKFKSESNDPSLDKFDATIEELNKWEDIRYPPDKPGPIGLSLDMRTGDKSVVKHPKTAKHYGVNLEDMDKLVKTLFEVMPLNPKFFKEFTEGEAERIYTMDNRHSMEVK